MQLESALRMHIFPRLGISSSDPFTIVLHGSRNGGNPRPDSDLDLLVVTSDPRPVEAEYHGELPWEGRFVSSELRVRSLSVVRQEIAEGDILRIRSLVHGHALQDPEEILPQLRQAAKIRFSEMQLQLLDKMGIPAPELLALIRISFAEMLSVLQAMATEDPVAAFARLTEFLIDFYLYTEIYDRLELRGRGLPHADLPDNVMLLSGVRPARMLQHRKYPMEPWFAALKEQIEHIVRERGMPGPEAMQIIFTNIETAFANRTRVILRPVDFDKLEVWLPHRPEGGTV